MKYQHIRTLGSDTGSPYLNRLSALLNPCQLIADQILAELVDNPPALPRKEISSVREYMLNWINLRHIATGGKQYLAELQQKESALTGISSLKIHFNNVFGYYLEVTNAQKHKVPETWIRKQTLANAERYITPELKEYEEKIMGAEEKIQFIEASFLRNFWWPLVTTLRLYRLTAQ